TPHLAKETPKSDLMPVFTKAHYIGVIGRSKTPSHVWNVER
ncbi:unnamed protein product, partial [marine sediment metagenome]